MRARNVRRAVVCFERQIVAQCNSVAPRRCSVYVASDSSAVSVPRAAQFGLDYRADLTARCMSGNCPLTVADSEVEQEESVPHSLQVVTADWA